MHQGDLEGVKGVHHINAVDEVTQRQVVGTAAQIGEQALIPVLEAMLAQFPFRLLASIPTMAASSSIILWRAC